MHRNFHRLLLLLVAFCSFGFGQVGFQLAPNFFPQFMDSNGKPLAGGFVQAYSAGSSTPLATYCDNVGTANTNPIVLGADGRPQSGSGAPCGIYLSQNSYKFCVLNSASVQIRCQDNVQNISQVLLTTANVWSLGQTFNALINFLGGTSDTTAAEGNVFYRTDIHRLRLYDGTAWRSLIGADSTDTLTNKTLASPTSTGTDSGSETLVNKSLTAATLTGTTQVTGQVNSTVTTGAAPFIIASTTPVPNLTTAPTTYNEAGTQVMVSHLVQVVQTLAGGTKAVTLVGSAVFTGAGTYVCALTDATSAAAVSVTYTSGSAFTITGTGTDVIKGICSGT